MMFWKTEKFKQEQDYWYKELKNTGFTDIEVGDCLKQGSANAYGKAKASQRHAKLEYYLAVSNYIRDKAPEFDSGIDLFVMHKISIGYSDREISRTLKAMDNSRHYKTIMYIRRKYENRWGLRKWLPHQLHSLKMPKRSSRS